MRTLVKSIVTMYMLGAGEIVVGAGCEAVKRGRSAMRYVDAAAAIPLKAFGELEEAGSRKRCSGDSL